MATMVQLQAYLKKHEVWVPKDAPRAYLEAAVMRHHLHAAGKLVDLGRCFGLWQDEDMSCLTCNAQGSCMAASLGMPGDEYLRQFEKQRARRQQVKREIVET